MPKKPTLTDLDPTTLTVHPLNVRRDLGDLRALTRSIREGGVLVPLLVVPHDGGHLVLAGHRRQAAAVEAGRPTVPCIVRHDLKGQADQIASMLIENVHREPLTAAEEAAAYEQLGLLGFSDTAIAAKTGATRKHVQQSRKLAGNEVASAVAERYELTLEQGLVIAEFSEDRDAVRDLTVTARKDHGRFAHLASRLRQDRERSENRAATVAALTEAGVAILDSRAATPTARPLRDLTNSDVNSPLTPEEHAECPGRAAFVSELSPDQPEHYCLDPNRYEHRDRYSARIGTAPTPITDEAKAERREVIENNKAWRAAEPVRRDFIRDLLARKTPPKDTLRFVTVEILTRPDRVGNGPDELLAELLGVEAPSTYHRSIGVEHLTDVTDKRLPLALLAQVAADAEQATGVHTWRSPNPVIARWFEFLVSAGYTPSDIEQHVIDTATGSAQEEAVA